MYFLTYNGLSVYDGSRFKNYTTQSGLLHNLVNDIVEITPDSFLLALNHCGLNTLVRGEIKNIDLGEICFINQMVREENGIIYATTDYGLYKLDKGRFEKLPAFWPGTNDLLMYLGDIINKGDYLIFTTNDLRNNTGLFLYSKKQNSLIDLLPEAKITDIETGPDGQVWVSTNKNTYVLDSTALAAGKLLIRKPYPLFLADKDLPAGSILFNRQKELLIFTGSNGSSLYRKDGSELHIPSPEPAGASVQALFDKEDILWITYDGNGVYKLANTKLQAVDLLAGEKSSGVKVVVPLSPDSTWFVMNDGHWILHSGAHNKVFTIKPFFDCIPLRSTKTHLYAISERTLYVSPLPAANNTQLSFKKILTLPDTSAFGGRAVEDPYGNIIFHERIAIGVLNKDKLIFSFPIDSYDLVEGFYISKDKKCWAATRGTAIRVFSIHPEDPSHYLQEEHHFYKELGGASPRCMLVDKDERIWIGTRSDGLMCFELNGNRLDKKMHLRIHEGLTDNFITSLACDRDNNIIVGTQTGMDKLIRVPGGYRIENVMKSNNIFAFINYVWIDTKDNAFGYANTGTIFQVSPERAEQSIREPLLLVEEIKVNGETISPGIASPRWKYFQRNINFTIAAPTFIDERQVQYSYHLAGSGTNEWSEPGNNADISLLNLSPGRYTLEVKASFPSTSYSPKQISYPFQILPPWWQTLWFRIPAAFVLLVIAMLIVRMYYRRKLEKEKSILEKQQAIEKERTRIATDMHDDLGAGLSRIKFLSETIGIKKQLQQPIEDDISSIRQYSHEMIDKMGEIVWALNEKNDSLSDLLAYTRSYAVEYLSQNGIHCIVNTPDNFPSTFVSGEYRRNIYLAVKEALHNIIKHAQATEVIITINIGRQLSISIADNGIGFGNEPARPYSNGLSNMKKRMEDIGGMLEIGHEKGTTIRLLSPIP
jgi:signal transduction histidine kinase/streptogramin lyase